MTADDHSQRVSELSARLDDLRTKCTINPANAPEILADVMEGLQASLEELSVADEDLIRQNEDLMQAQSVLREKEEQLRTTLESIGDGFFACDADWRFVYVNASAERIRGNTLRGGTRQKPLGGISPHVGDHPGAGISPRCRRRVQRLRELL
jgi:PAS domain-containing protein